MDINEETMKAMISMASITGLTRNVPHFSGSSDVSVKVFLSKIECVGLVGSTWDDNQKINVAKLHMDGDALFFVNTHPVLKSTQNWNTYKTVLIERFAPKPVPAIIEIEFSNCNQIKTENIVTYAHRLRVIAEQLCTLPDEAIALEAINKMLDNRLMQQFISGVLPIYQRDLWLSNPENFDKAIETAKRLETIFNMNSPYNSINEDVNTINEINSSLNISEKIAAGLAPLVAQINAIQSQSNFRNNSEQNVQNSNNFSGYRNNQFTNNPRQNFHNSFSGNQNSNTFNNPRTSFQNRNNYPNNQYGQNFDRNRFNNSSNVQSNQRQNANNQRSNSISNIMCFNCENIGHFARNCPLRYRTNSNNAHENKICNRCKKTGHLTINCHARLENSSNPQTQEQHSLNYTQSSMPTLD